MAIVMDCRQGIIFTFIIKINEKNSIEGRKNAQYDGAH
jgi:hypothetical protein